ncbi:MAG: hypothetical protein HY543_03130 [Deltaproteobacteria bacterium]|nr:hypothetical protein [Deltaproteobacteria bacterium]
MRFKEFRQRMKKDLFSWEEARVIAFATPPSTLKLQLHQWKQVGDLVALKRGLYVFAGMQPPMAEIVSALYAPCYISLEYALNHYGLLPDIPFGVTLVTPKATRKFTTPLGQFSYQKLKKAAFFGFDPVTLLASSEKAMVDYLYLNRHRCVAEARFWEEMRWQNLPEVHFRKTLAIARRLRNKKVEELVQSLATYAKSPAAR